MRFILNVQASAFTILVIQFLPYLLIFREKPVSGPGACLAIIKIFRLKPEKMIKDLVNDQVFFL